MVCIAFFQAVLESKAGVECLTFQTKQRIPRQTTMRTLTVGILLSAFIFSDACAQTERNQPAAQHDHATLLRTAERFVKSVNAGNAAIAFKVIGLPLMYRNQEWKDATAGEGYVLGDAHDQVFTDEKRAAKFLEGLVRDLRLENTTPEKDGPSKVKMMSDYLAGAPVSWRDLELFFFVRGTGDVEHVVLIGIDSSTGKVRGIYMN